MYDYPAKIERWHDADTVLLTIDEGFGNSITCWIRFYQCWAQEVDTPGGQAALAWVEERWPPGSKVFVLTRKPSPGVKEFEGKQLGQTFARWLGTVYPADVMSGSIGSQLVTNGYATITATG